MESFGNSLQYFLPYENRNHCRFLEDIDDLGESDELVGFCEVGDSRSNIY